MRWIRWRYFCPKFFRQSFVEYAGQSIQHSFWAKAYYSRQRLRGKERQAAVRALAFKWIRIIWKCRGSVAPFVRRGVDFYGPVQSAIFATNLFRLTS